MTFRVVALRCQEGKTVMYHQHGMVTKSNYLKRARLQWNHITMYGCGVLEFGGLR